MKAIRQRIERELAGVRVRLGLSDDLGPTNGGRDEGDVAARSFERDLSIADRQALTTRALALWRALEKVRTGEYGVCEWCDHRIEPKRLEAIPEAALCLGCQARKERDEEEPEAGVRRTHRPITRPLEELGS